MLSKPIAPPLKPVSETKPVSQPAQALPPATDRRNGHTPPMLDAGPATRTPYAMSKPRSRWGWLITLFILSGLCAAAWYYHATWYPSVKGLLFSGGPPAKPPPRPIPIVSAVVKKRNMDLFLNGLGTVTSLKTVTVRSRVEGELISIAFSEGQMVHQGQLIAEIDTRPFVIQRDQAAGQLIRDKAALDIAKLNLNRLNKLLPTMAVTQQAVDEQIALVKQAEGVIKSDEAMIANAELQLVYCRIEAPVTGRIGLRLVDVGNIVRANDPGGLAVITQLEPIALVFTIPQDDIPRVQKRMREGHVLTVDAYDRDFQVKLASGNLKAIDNQVDPTTGTLRMKAEFEKNDNILFPNQFVNTRLLVDTRRDATVVPSAAVQRGPSSTFVYLVKSDETVELRNVVLGPTEGAETSIESGIIPGDVVVTDGIDKLQPGSKVTLREKKAGEGKGAGGKGHGAKDDSTKGDVAKRESTKDEAPKADARKTSRERSDASKPDSEKTNTVKGDIADGVRGESAKAPSSNDLGSQEPVRTKPEPEQPDQITPDSVQAGKADAPKSEDAADVKKATP
jgi:multidrug efflux system membrane fusion protein